ncbi:hypothetical protein D3C77_569110 [compost metagenome]
MNLEATVIAVQRHIAFLATDLGAVLLCAEFNEGLNVTEGYRLEISELCVEFAGTIYQLFNQTIPLLIDRLDHALRHQTPLGVLPESFGHYGLWGISHDLLH